MNPLFILIKWIVGLSLVLSLVMAVLHLWSDEDLDTEAARWLEPEVGIPAPESNAYYWIQGFEAPAGQDPQIVGMAHAEAISAALLVREQSGRFDVSPPAKGIRLSDEVEDVLCKQEDPDCPAQIARSHATIRQGMGDAQVLVGRYRALYNRPFYHDPNPSTFDAPIPSFGALLTIQRLILANAWLDAQAGRIDDAAAALEQDLHWSRRLLGNAQGLIPKMVATALVRQDLHLLAHLLDLGTAPSIEGLVGRLSPLAPVEYDLGPSMRLEFAIAADFFRTLPRVAALSGEDYAPHLPRGAALLPLKVKTTLNRTFASYRGIAQISRLDHRAFAEQAAALHPFEPGVWDYVLNPVGTILLQIATPAFAQYYARLRDLEGLIRLARIKQMVLTQGIAADAVPALLATLPLGLRNPFTGAPMDWHAATATLSFPSAAGPEPTAFPGERRLTIPSLAPRPP